MDEKEVCQRWKGQALHPQALLLVHVKWETRNKEPLLCDEEIRHVAYTAISNCAREYLCRPLAIGGTADHVHAVFRFPASFPVATLIRQTTQASGKAIVRHLNFLSGRLVSAETIWDCHCGVWTLGESELPHVINYVEQQTTLHECGQTCEEWEQVMAPCEPRLPRNESSLLRGKTGIPFSPN